MQQQVMISIRGEQEYEGTEKDVTEFVTEGTLTSTDYGYALEYDESALTRMEGTHTAFEIHPNSVSLVRTGRFHSQMIFERDKKHYSLYETPYGTMTLDIVTRTLRADLDETGGELEIRYAIEIEHQITGTSRFFIQVRQNTAAEAEKQNVKNGKGW